MTRVPGLLFGGDYNPEQWPEEVWAEDVRLMAEAGVTIVTVGVFSWSRLESAPGEYDFAWLDRVLDLLHGNGIAVDLATATATPPPWLVRRHPEMLPVNADGVRLEFGSRQGYCPSSPVFRDATRRLARAMAERYGNHPALAMWHISNEYADHTLECFCDESARHFQRFLVDRYTSLDGLNRAWGTSCWGQHYTDWPQVQPPRRAPGPINPAQMLDWRRFCSDALLECFDIEREVLREVTPEIPVTTNFMSILPGLDYWKWAAAEDFVSDDAYPDPSDPAAHVGVALSYDLMRSLKRRPWLLLESAPSAVSWREVNVPKPPGAMRLHSLQALAHGSDGVMFFQWRQAKYGPEKFHSAMLPHGGTDTRQWRETVALGADVARLAEIAGTTTKADVALVMDWPSWWGLEAAESMPSNRLRLKDLLMTWYVPLHSRGVAVDLAPPSRDLSAYRLVIVPNLYLCTEQQAANLASFDGTLIVGPFTGVVDADEQVHDGGAPGPLRDLLGVRVEEPWPLPDGRFQSVRLANGSTAAATTWTEWISPIDAKTIAIYQGGDLDGRPAITQKGNAVYLSCVLDDVTRLLNLLTNAPSKTTPHRDSTASVPDDKASVHGDVASLSDDTASVHVETASVRDAVASLSDDMASVHVETASVRGDVASLHDDTASVHHETASVQDETTSVHDHSGSFLGDLPGDAMPVRAAAPPVLGRSLSDGTAHSLGGVLGTGLDLPPGVEACRRDGADASYLFLLNHSTERVSVALPHPGIDLLTGRELSGWVDLAARDAVVIKSQVGLSRRDAVGTESQVVLLSRDAVGTEFQVGLSSRDAVGTESQVGLSRGDAVGAESWAELPPRDLVVAQSQGEPSPGVGVVAQCGSGLSPGVGVVAQSWTGLSSCGVVVPESWTEPSPRDVVSTLPGGPSQRDVVVVSSR